MLDFDLGLTKVPLSFPVGFPTSGGIPDDVSDSEILTSKIKWNALLVQNDLYTLASCHSFCTGSFF